MAESRRILVTGLSTYWGGRLAAALERNPDVEAIIGVDSEDPTRELDRTEFVRVSNQHAPDPPDRAAAEIDTVVDTRLVVDSATTAPRLAHENNVMGTLNILAACSGPDSPGAKARVQELRPLLRHADATIPPSSPRTCAATTRRGRR